MELENEQVKKENWGGSRENSGREPFEPTEDEQAHVELLSGYGVPIEQIAIVIRNGIGLSTLRRHFSHELMKGKAKANGQIGRGLFQKAMSGDTTAMIWWTKTQMKWSETVKNEITGADGTELKNIQITFVKPDGSH